MLLKKNPDTVTILAIIAGVAAGGYILYTALKTKTPPLLTIGKPTATPQNVGVGQPVTINVQIGSAVQGYVVQCQIFEGGLLPGIRGSLVDSLTASIKVPGTQIVSFIHTPTSPGSVESRDVKIKVVSGSSVLLEREWDDIFYVKSSLVKGFVGPGIILGQASFTANISESGFKSSGYVLGQATTSVTIPQSDWKPSSYILGQASVPVDISQSDWKPASYILGQASVLGIISLGESGGGSTDWV